MQPRQPIEVLLVEDSAADIRLTTEALRRGKVANNLHVTRDGEAAMAFLRSSGIYADAPRPDLVLLDLNLPRKDGREVLAEMKQDDELRTIPVVVLTTSSEEEDVLQAYELNANSYVTKPVDFQRFLAVVGTIEDFWLQVVRLPSAP